VSIKNPVTTPLFQAIQTAHEKLTCKENRAVEEEKMRAAAAAAASAATRPSEPPPANSSPQRPPSARPNHNPAAGSTSSTSNDGNTQESPHKQKQPDKSSSSRSDRLKEEIARQRAAAEAAKRKAQEEEEAKYAGMSPEEREFAKHREKERKAAEERTAARRAKTGYANYVPEDESGGKGRGEARETTSEASSARNQSPPPSQQQQQQSSTPTKEKPRTEQHREEREKEREEESGAARQRKQKKVLTLPIPSALTGSALDHTSVQLEWQILLPLHTAAGTKEAAVFAAMKTELAYREVMHYLKADGAVYHSTGQEWTMGSMLLSGEKVIKKNLLPGHKYEFRVRFVVPQSTRTAGSAGTAGMIGAWSEPFTISLRPRPAGSEFMPPGPDNDLHRERTGGAGPGLKRNDSGLPEEVPEGLDGNFSTHIHNIRNMKGGKTPAQWGGNRVADSSASLYGRHFGSATSLPEEVADDDDIVPDQWVEDGSDSEGEEAPKRHSLKRGAQGASVVGEEEEGEEDVHAKWYQLMPPDSHVGTGKYKHPVRVARKDDASVVGYVSSVNRVKAKKKTAEWMQVQVHFTTAAAALNADVGTGGGDGSPVLPYGWMKRCEWNHRLQREHEMLRHIPESYKEMKRFNHVTTAIPEEEEGAAVAEEGNTPMAAAAGNTRPKQWQHDAKARRVKDNSCADGGVDRPLQYSKATHNASGNIDIWYEQVDPGGYLYYYNAATGESRWEPPEWVEETDETSGARCATAVPRSLRSVWIISVVCVCLCCAGISCS
jgi:hypothetical protein